MSMKKISFRGSRIQSALSGIKLLAMAAIAVYLLVIAIEFALSGPETERQFSNILAGSLVAIPPVLYFLYISACYFMISVGMRPILMITEGGNIIFVSRLVMSFPVSDLTDVSRTGSKLNFRFRSQGHRSVNLFMFENKGEGVAERIRKHLDAPVGE